MKEDFLNFSAEITAFSLVELYGTGQAEAYFQAVVGVVGQDLLERLLAEYAKVPQQDDHYTREELLSRAIFGDPHWGPIARNIIKLWYFGVWTQLPKSWSQSFGALEKDVNFVVNTSSYAEGLLWKAIDANPPGAKAPGYGSWANAPIQMPESI